MARGLRQLREEAGFTGVQTARLAGMSQSKVSKLETGMLLPSVANVETLCRVLGAPPEQREELIGLATALRNELESVRVILQRGAYRKQQEIGRVEAETIMLRSFHPTLVLGLAQTADYMREVFATMLAGDNLDRAIAGRLERQRVFDDETKHFILVMGEGALRWRAAPTEVMVGQLEHLAALIARPNLRIGVIPWTARVRVFPAHGFHIYDDRLVAVDMETANATIRDPRDIATYLELFAALEQVASFDDEARSVLARIAEDYRRLDPD